MFVEDMSFRAGRESVASKTENEMVGQGGRQSGVTQSMSSRPPLPECLTCGRKHVMAHVYDKK